MAMIKYNGKEVPVAEDWRLSELSEGPSNARGFGYGDGEVRCGRRTDALIIYICHAQGRPRD